MKTLLVGGGGREHALAWAMRRSGSLADLLLLPGNPGMSALGHRIEGIEPTDVGAVAAVAAAQAVDLVVVGPEAPLAAGLTDALLSRGIPAFGPTRAAARLESSKSYAKEVMKSAGVPTAEAAVFDDATAAHDHLGRAVGPFVVKADGLAAGKGVLVTDEVEAAHRWVDRCFQGDFGSAGSTVLIEDFLSGPEVSVFAMCAGRTAVTLAPARDYKRLLDADLGPNTGGMGAFSPVPDLPAGLVDKIRDTVVLPVLTELDERGDQYTGFLYAGLVLADDGPQVLEFNCRLGDPEAQVVLPRLEDDLVEVMLGALDGSLPEALQWSTQAAVDVVLATAGYPDEPRIGDPISGTDAVADLDDVLLFHAATTGDDRRPITAGGRVLNVVGLGEDLAAARRRAYEAVELVRFPGMTYRNDIGAVNSPVSATGTAPLPQQRSVSA
jgi:phosphoribosylamine---glycine ligase